MTTEILRFKRDIYNISHEGPIESDYLTLLKFFEIVSQNRNNLNYNDLMELRSWFLGAMDDERTLQGHVCLKPRGYDGDFTIIDKIYTFHKSNDRVLARWDEFFHLGDAPKAVRNRKTYFKEILFQLPEKSHVLNLASGSCRDLFEFAGECDKSLKIDCVDLDIDSISFGKTLLSKCSTLSANFIHQNIFKFVPTKQYDLIWSAGLFDYLDDKHFSSLLKRFIHFVKPDGYMIIGNFNTNNNSRSYMEFGNWFLHHRDPESLERLAHEINYSHLFVDSEPLNVNLFLHIKK